MSKNKPSLKEKEAISNNTISGGIDSFDDQLALPPALIKELEDKDLVYRWINAKTLQDNYGYDRRQWSPYKMENSINIGSLLGRDTEGYVRRGDLILAVQTKDVAARRKALINRRRAALSNSTQRKDAAEQLKKTMRDANIDAKIYEGYEENGSEEE